MEPILLVHNVLLERESQGGRKDTDSEGERAPLQPRDDVLASLSSQELLHLLVLHKGMLVDGLHDVSEENF